MSQSESKSHAPSVDELETDISHTRDDLADTVDALAAKFDVKTRARERIETVRSQAKDASQDVRERLIDEEGKPRRGAIGAAAVTAAGVLAAVVIRKRRG